MATIFSGDLSVGIRSELSAPGIGGHPAVFDRPHRPPFIQEIAEQAIALVERAFAVDRADILGEYRKAEMVEARHVVVWLLREATDAQHITIATTLNRRTHVMSVQGFWRVQERRKRDAAFRTMTDALLDELRARDAGPHPLAAETA
jgi:hypothetical protein